MSTETLFLTLIDGAHRPAALRDDTAITWWQAAEGAGWRGYRVGAPGVGEWTALTPIVDQAGPSHGEPALFHYVVETDVADVNEEEFNAWYQTEHLPGLASVPGTIRARRYLRATGAPRYVACYELISPEVMRSAEWLAVRHTDWSSRVRPMFFNTRRTLYVRPQA